MRMDLPGARLKAVVYPAKANEAPLTGKAPVFATDQSASTPIRPTPIGFDWPASLAVILRTEPPGSGQDLAAELGHDRLKLLQVGHLIGRRRNDTAPSRLTRRHH